MAKKKRVKKKSPRKKQAVPELLLFVACDAVSRDPSTGKVSLYGLFDIVWADQFPARTNFSIFAKIKGRGNYPISVVLTTPAGKREVVGEATVECPNDGTSALSIVFNGVLKRAGVYQFKLVTAGRTLGHPLDVVVKRRAT